MAYAYVAEYTSFASDIDLSAAPPADANAGGVARLEVVDAGSGGLSLRLSGSSTTVTLTALPTGDVEFSPSRILASGTTVAKVRVWWNRRAR